MSTHLNLARAWRSRTFDEIVGQDLTVRLIKNSLYRGHFFPVYLLSGQRGCGKTSMGRLFAAAVNCAQLPAFQQKPQEIVLPCRTCHSCQAMIAINHPDFIEIDAASHTGVDNIRTIIEAASFLPLIGHYKVYLIDEAHMLSKAAFNAFLKILEEPPRSVLFLLATTEPLKIIDTLTLFSAFL
jgi:DNA polymerase III subunit gamma/tau